MAVDVGVDVSVRVGVVVVVDAVVVAAAPTAASPAAAAALDSFAATVHHYSDCISCSDECLIGPLCEYKSEHLLDK